MSLKVNEFHQGGIDADLDMKNGFVFDADLRGHTGNGRYITKSSLKQHHVGNSVVKHTQEFRERQR